ncbi:MopE-related protein [Paraflavisolibacter sp. H34]|uniref:MopE-related protein n=1 Tax=Huijunlia imazamoxiresistens TaxID=3127457 RepID=UPI00301A1EE2
MKWRSSLFATLFLFLSPLQPDARAQAGRLDARFAAKGWLTTSFAPRNEGFENGRQVLALPGGALLVVLRYEWGCLLARYLPGGTLDQRFGSGGYSDYLDLEPWGAALQSDGKILVAGRKYNGTTGKYDVAVARYLPGGSLDRGFGGDGLQIMDFGGRQEGAVCVALQSNGRVVVGGYSLSDSGTSSHYALARYLPNGAPDPSFDGDGKVFTDFGPPGELTACALAVQPDGKILLTGSALGVRGSADWVLARYLPGGSLDRDFGSGGLAFTDFDASGDWATSLSLQPDGRILTGGSAYNQSTGRYEFAVARHLPDGSADSSFGSGGKARLGTAGKNYAASLSLQEDGKIVVGGTSYQFPAGDYYAGRNYASLLRLLPDGSPDKGFGSGGWVTALLAPVTGDRYGEVAHAALQRDGRIVLTGLAYNQSVRNDDYVLLRFLPDGSPDKGFDGDGLLEGYYLAETTWMSDLAVQGDGKVVVAGATGTGEARDFALARFLPDGRLDGAFGRGGKVTSDLGAIEHACGIALQSDGRIVVAGESLINGSFDLVLARYLPDGTLDSSFGAGGKVTTGASGHDFFGSLALQSDGKLLLAGSSPDSATGYDLVLLRYLPNGRPDPGFGARGRVTADFSGTKDFARSLGVQNDGKIVVAGEARGSTGTIGFALARFLPNGGLDPSFADKGKGIYRFGATDCAARALVLQADGKLVAAGSCFKSGEISSQFLLARFLSDGRLDSTFGTKGWRSTAFRQVGEAMETAECLALQSDGKLVAGGWSFHTVFSTSSAVLARYHPDGRLDSSFDGDGRLVTYFGQMAVDASGLALHKDRLYVAGTITGADSKGLLAAYLTGPAWKTFFHDGDRDGYGADNASLTAAAPPSGYVKKGGDCDDGNPLVHPGAPEAANGRDDDCDGQVDEARPLTSFPAAPMHEEGAAGAFLAVAVAPNPSPHAFTLTLKCGSLEPVRLRVLDAGGKVMEVRERVAAVGATLLLGRDYRPGIYLLEVVQGNMRQVLRLVKSAD